MTPEGPEQTRGSLHGDPFRLVTALPRDLDLDLTAEKGIQIVSTISYEILELIAAGRLRDETVLLNGLTRVKTNADRISGEMFHEMLRRELPEFAILSEQTRVAGLASPGNIPIHQPYAILDPIDGTIHLQKNDGQWILNLGLCVAGDPFIGISAVPAENKLYLGVKGRPSMEISLDGKTRRVLEGRKNRGGSIFGICSLLDVGGRADIRDRWKRIAETNGATEIREFGSAYSYLKVADGTLDVFVNLGGNFHWDTAAQQVILEGAGARLVNIDWQNPTIDIARADSCRYDLHLVKDEGHIAARNGLVVRIDPNFRTPWKAVFD